MPINVVSKGEGEATWGRDAGRENNEAKSAGRINHHDDWSDSDWVEEEGRQSGKPKLIEFILSSTYPNSSAALVSLQTANPPDVSPRSIILHHSILPFLTLYHIFLSFHLPLHPHPSTPTPLLYCLDLGRLELPPRCPPASYESHGGQGPRGCQGLLMTPSPAITSGWQLYLHKTSRQHGEPAQSKWHTHIHTRIHTCTVQKADMS